MWIDTSDSGKVLVAGVCEYDNEPNGFIKGRRVCWSTEWLVCAQLETRVDIFAVFEHIQFINAPFTTLHAP
jgi:hypothetical protein